MELQLQNLDDIQLALVLAVYNYKGSSHNTHLLNASDYLEWIKKKRTEIEQAKLLEKEQRIKDYNAGYTDAQCNHINDAENYANEQEYLNGTKE